MCTPQVHGSIDYVKNKRFRLRGKCFGNLISPKHVITAASCIIDKYECLRNKVCASKAYIEEMRVAKVLSYNLIKLKYCTPSSSQEISDKNWRGHVFYHQKIKFLGAILNLPENHLIQFG